MKKRRLNKRTDGRSILKEPAKLRLYIPTYRRTTFQKTFGLLPRKWQKRVTFVCDVEDEPKLRKLLKRERYAKLWVVPRSIKTIAQKRAWIIENTSATILLMLDDDLRFCTRHYKEKKSKAEGGSDKSSQINSTYEQIDEALTRIENMLQKYAHVGISAKQGNNNMPGRGFAKNVRMIYGLGYQVATVRNVCRLGRIEHREDMDYTLQLLRRGFANRVLLDHCVDQLYNTPGGASVDRKQKDSDRDAELLAKLHSPFVKVVEKKYKVSQIRKEVICSWKKAFAQGQRRAAAARR